MKRSLLLVITALVIMVVSIGAFAQSNEAQVKGTIIAPPITRDLPSLKVHPPLYIFVPEGGIKPDAPPANAENPGSIACIYGVTPPTSGCPRSGSPVATGGSKAIAVVEYGHNTNTQPDFNAFNTQYGLPAQTLQFICDCGSCPDNTGSGFDIETALDVEYAHAMAPNAQIIVAEFCSDPYQGGKSAAEYLAGQAVSGYGGGEVSNSFGYGGEFSGELSYDQYMTSPNVVYFASTGDSGCRTDYPEASPNVVAAGGTHIIRDSNGNFTGNESVWSGSGGGISSMEALPNYQLIIGNIAGAHRGTPDVSADADPNTGVAVYSTPVCHGWCQVGGTSVSSPVLAGIVNAAGHFYAQTSSENAHLYSWYRNPGQYRQYLYDVTQGSNGGSCGSAKVGWDKDTGLGTPRNLAGF